MPAADSQPGPAHGSDHFQGLAGIFLGTVMLAGRGAISRLVADLAVLTPGDTVVDVGCGPGGAAREAARRGAVVTGVDPAPMMLRLGRYLSGKGSQVSYRKGTAESLPVPDEAATVAWSISSAHHWRDVPAGLREIHRVLEPGGRVIIAERLTRPGARGLAAHGTSEEQADETMAAARSAGFANVRRETCRAGRKTMLVVRGARPAPEP
jgi:SAM-dependent methyltransferase